MTTAEHQQHSHSRGLVNLFRRLRSPTSTPQRCLSESPRETPVPSRTSSSSSLSSLVSGNRSYGKKVSLLGTGITAKVELFYHKNTNQFYAIKTFKPKESYESRDEYRTRCSKEFEVMRDLNHPNILKAYDCIPGIQSFQIVLEYAPVSLLKVVQANKPTETECLCFFRQVADGLHFLHQQHIAHRDLKMENLVVDETATVKLIDFGTAFQFGHKKLLAMGNVGTEALVSPEALCSLKYDAEANDVWALGVLLYSMLNLSFPWDAARESDVKYKDFLADRGSIKSGYPDHMWNLMTRVLDTDREKRIKMPELHRLIAEETHEHSKCAPKVHKRTIKLCQSKKAQTTAI